LREEKEPEKKEDRKIIKAKGEKFIEILFKEEKAR
jgi:hypothetical protein